MIGAWWVRRGKKKRKLVYYQVFPSYVQQHQDNRKRHDVLEEKMSMW